VVICTLLSPFLSSSLPLFLSSSLHLFISSSLHLFISSSLPLAPRSPDPTSLLPRLFSLSQALSPSPSSHVWSAGHGCASRRRETEREGETKNWGGEGWRKKSASPQKVSFVGERRRENATAARGEGREGRGEGGDHLTRMVKPSHVEEDSSASTEAPHRVAFILFLESFSVLAYVEREREIRRPARTRRHMLVIDRGTDEVAALRRHLFATHSLCALQQGAL